MYDLLYRYGSALVQIRVVKSVHRDMSNCVFMKALFGYKL